MKRPLSVAMDSSPGSLAAVRWAVAEAERRGVPLRLVHVWPVPRKGIPAADAPPLDVDERTRQELARVHPELTTEFCQISGDPVDELLAVGRDSELMVLGSRGLGGFEGLMVGSVSLAVASHAEVPVVLVRAGRRGIPAPADAGEVVVGVDTRHRIHPVIGFGLEEAAMRQAPVRFLHIWGAPAVGYPGALVTQIDLAELQRCESEALGEAIGDWRGKFPDVEVVDDVRLDEPARALVEASRKASLVVVGRRGREHGFGVHLGPVAHAVIHHSHAPVAVIPVP